MSKQTYKVCFCCSRRFKLTASEAPEEIKTLFGKYSENGVMTANHLHRFLIEEQKEDKATIQDAQAIIDSTNFVFVFHKNGLNLPGFFKFLFGDLNPPLSPTKGAHQDMAAPLSHYFIYTGHNSYLTGNQLTSDCSDVPIKQALEKSVRVIELDIWPNSSKDNVDVLHGGTMTSPVELITCLRCIKEYAFSVSDYPVVITLEDHLTPDLQAKTAEMITETFGDTLFLPDAECFKELPSPESLKKHVMISTKPPIEYREAQDNKEDSQKAGKDSGDEEGWGKEVPNLRSDSQKHNELEDGDDNESEEEDGDDDDINKSKKFESPEYLRLIAIQAGKPKGGLGIALKVDPNKVRRLSLSEPQLEKAATHHGREIVRFTQKNMLRIYPKGTRITSSNYNPLIGWMHGAQMVAFNMQGYGRSLWLMQGMFRANGGCGYVKKPNFLLSTGPHGEVFDPKVKLPPKKTLKVGIAGVAADTVMKKTRTLEDNWIPAWNEEFEFPLSVPELALLRIEVHEYDMSEKDDFGGQTCYPVWELREGIRTVPLCNREGVKYPSVKLLMRFEFV
ncbi:Phosphoinositide phospholipase C 2 [Bienertia sinuspersici]